ncbi:hypothetical protein I3U61_21880 [Mycobacteroides abscessus subsp. massiliense]|uniref:hypothetical protein n=1 Tax=Mycobacteroides abscessus TaxID=36809 RepID=UPI0019D0C70E|nr:hypothetical protein [Mycobacteroides abscessus]MBN7566656.1 hypothetical protein [Mycobacteroides abscessus subsp. massiliense]
MIFINVYQGVSNRREGKSKYQWTFPDDTPTQVIATELYNKESKTVGESMNTSDAAAILAHIEDVIQMALRGGTGTDIAGLVIQVTRD